MKNQLRALNAEHPAIPILRQISLVAFLLIAVGQTAIAQRTNYFHEGFETGSVGWFADSGTWEIGVPTSGPGRAFEGTSCAATVLAGNYAEGVDSRLVSPSFVVPNANVNPCLRFWHWFSFSSYDAGIVQIRIGTGAWTNLSSQYDDTGSGVWTCPSIDLKAYAGRLVQIGFRLTSATCGGCSPGVSSGWYIDEVTVTTGAVQTLIANVPEGFELGLRDWSADGGTWEVGVPTVGPPTNALGRRAFAGTNCAATVLAGSYDEWVDSRLVGPPFVVPPAATNPRLRFWHWFSFSSYDSGVVQIKPGTNAWQTISSVYDDTGSGVWTSPSLDLSAYGNQTIQIGFHISTSTCGGCGWGVSSGWYIDDVTLTTGAVQTIIANVPEGFELGLRDWSADAGTWEVGVPISGPATNTLGRRALVGTNCAATVLAGNYDEWVDSRLVSPSFPVPPSASNPRLRFWHWFSFSSFDSGVVQIKSGTNGWQNISPVYDDTSSGVWTSPYIDLTAYANQTVQIGFRLTTSTCGGCGWGISSGWYIDEVMLVTGPIIFSNPDGFELGLGDWSADAGTWQVGRPTSGPGNAKSGTNCAATVLAGNYDEWVDSRLVSPPFVVPPAATNPQFQFSHWFNFSSYDKGVVQIKTAGSGWQDITDDYVNTSSGIWTSTLIPLRAYAGQTVQMGFRISTSTCGGCGWGVNSGWYIDDVRLLHEFALVLGSSVGRTQETSCVSVGIAASGPIQNVSFTLETLPGALANAILSTEGCWSNLPLITEGDSRWRISLQDNCPSASMGMKTVGSFCFSSIPTQSSFAPLSVANLLVNLTPARFGFGNRAVIIGNEPLLDVWLAPNGRRMVTTYGKPNTTYEIRATTNIIASSPWTLASSNRVPAALSITAPVLGPLSNAPVLFLRANEK